MKNYIVAILSFFDNDIKQFKITAKNEYEAVKKGMVQFCIDDEKDASEYEIAYQNLENYPKNIKELEEVYYHNNDIVFSIMEVKEF